MKKLLCVLFAICAVSQLMSAEINWSFPPSTLSASGINASNPSLAMDSNGNIVAVWIENGVVKSKSKLVSSGWSGSSATLSGSGASSPRVVSDLNGNSAAIWVENGIIRASTKTLSGNWSSSTSLSTSGASSPSLAVGVAGDLVAVWVRSGNIESSTKLFGANWQTRVTITSSGAAFPSVAIGGSGSNTRAIVVWQGVASSVNVVFASTRLISGSWSAQQRISDNLRQAGYPDVAVDTNGNAIAVWYCYDVKGPVYSGVVVQSSSRPSTGSWSPITSLSSAGMRNPATLGVRVAYDGTGNAIALWSTSFDDENFSIQSSIKHLNQYWADPITLVNGNLFSNQADLSVSSLGEAISVYLFYNGAALQIQSSQLDITGFMNSLWSVPINISQGTSNAYPSVATTLTGDAINAAAVWISSDGTNNQVVASTGTVALVLPPADLSVTQSANGFGVFTEYYNTLSWTASSSPTVVGYLIYRNGEFIQQVDASVLQFDDNNRVQNGSVTYGVAAIDDQQSHSRIITVTYP